MRRGEQYLLKILRQVEWFALSMRKRRILIHVTKLLLNWKQLCSQIARFSHQSSEPSKSGHKIFGSTAFALILQPTQRHEEYKRIGIAEIPTEDGMADGWDTKIVTIV
jgi:hypothetical protein